MSDELKSSSPGRGKNFFLSTILHSTQTGSEAHPASYPVDTGGDSPGVKRPGRETDHLSPSSAEVKNGGAIPLLPHMASWHSA
jgi:hypothetical protein